MTLAAARAAARAAKGPEGAVQAAMAALIPALGDRAAHLREGALEHGQRQFFVGGAFFATPDRKLLMLVGNSGFPPEQRRLLIPIDGGHPGRVMASAAPLLLTDTRQHQVFRQYLKTARMGSAVYAPLVWDGQAQGLLIAAAQAGGTMGPADLAALVALSRVVRDRWLALGGPAWLATEYAAVTAAGGVADPGR